MNHTDCQTALQFHGEERYQATLYWLIKFIKDFLKLINRVLSSFLIRWLKIIYVTGSYCM